MGYWIKCSDTNCNKITYAINIVDLIKNHRDESGKFICSCGKNGYIEKSFPLQEEGEVWEPVLQGIITLGEDSLWFSYYKDLRESGGRLKLGYGPGGPPVLHKDTFLELLEKLMELDIISKEEVKRLID
jgi:hypothetical protein